MFEHTLAKEQRKAPKEFTELIAEDDPIRGMASIERATA